MPVQPRRKPARKFVSRKFSERRLRRIMPIERHFRESFGERFQIGEMFKAAEKFLALPQPGKSALIFVGQKMRPLFEAVRGMNELKRVFGRRDIKYIVTPPSKALFEFPSLGETVRKNLAAKGISRNRTVYVVDYRNDGATFRAIQKALKSIDPKAVVVEINQYSEDLGPAVAFSEGLASPTRKDLQGRVSRGFAQDIDEYLFYQKLLQEHLAQFQKKSG